MTRIRVANEAEVVDAVRSARNEKTPFDIIGAGTKHEFGRPTARSERVLDVSGLAGIVNYEPEELVLTARPGTPIAQIEEALSARGQRLGFDPPDWGALFGAKSAATLGGSVSADASGSLRVRHGSARDHLLGIRAVNGFGEVYKAGGKVVKNVTGFDIPKLMCGAFGTLSVLTELTFRVFPKPSQSETLVVPDIAPTEGFALLRQVWTSPLEATGLAYVPPGAAALELGEIGRGAALIRIEGALRPLAEKRAILAAALGSRAIAGVREGDKVFRDLSSGAVFADVDQDVWRIFLPPAEAGRAAEAIRAPSWYGDLAGGLLWVGLAADEAAAIARMRAAVARAGGHATLVRAGAATRLRVAVFPQETPERASLTRAVKAAFDPLSLFNPGRMYEGI